MIEAKLLDPPESRLAEKMAHIGEREVVQMAAVVPRRIAGGARKPAPDQRENEAVIADVGRGQDQATTGSKHPRQFAGEMAGVQNMLNDIQTGDAIKRAVAIRKVRRVNVGALGAKAFGLGLADGSK